jgi:hypothetical protein
MSDAQKVKPTGTAQSPPSDLEELLPATGDQVITIPDAVHAEGWSAHGAVQRVRPAREFPEVGIPEAC